MNSYSLSRDFWDWCFENPEKIKPNHSAIYFFAIESFKSKNEGLAAERSLIKFFSYFQYESIVNGLYVNIALEGSHINLIKRIKNGRLG